MTNKALASPKYLKTLLLFFEEEIMGEAYFLDLQSHFYSAAQKERLVVLSKVERYAAEAVRPLLEKYALTPRPEPVLHALGRQDTEKTAALGWEGFLRDIVERYPDYVDQFEALERMGPSSDLTALKTLTDHEPAAIAFARRELANEVPSLLPLRDYLGGARRLCLHPVT